MTPHDRALELLNLAREDARAAGRYVRSLLLQSGATLWRPVLLLFVIGLPATETVTARSVQPGPRLPHVAPTLGPPPSNCPRVSPVLAHRKKLSSYSSIIWVGRGALIGYSGWMLQSHRLTLTFGARTKYGYPQKIFWQRTAHAPPQIALYGWNLRTRQRVWFGDPVPQAHTTSGVEPPVIAWPSGLVRDHFVHGMKAPTLTFVPAAGCYVIEARWRGGSWTLPFAAGSD